MRSALIILAAVLTLSACATASNYPLMPGTGQPDMTRFKVYTAIGVPESHVNGVIAPKLDAYRAKNGYRENATLDRRWNYGLRMR